MRNLYMLSLVFVMFRTWRWFYPDFVFRLAQHFPQFSVKTFGNVLQRLCEKFRRFLVGFRMPNLSLCVCVRVYVCCLCCNLHCDLWHFSMITLSVWVCVCVFVCTVSVNCPDYYLQLLAAWRTLETNEN